MPRGLYALCDDEVGPERSLVDKACGVLAGGTKILQLRMKRTGARAGLELVRAVAERCRAAGAVLIVNDRVDLALVGGAHGVHLGDEDLPVAAARAVLGPGSFVGATVRSLEAIHEAMRRGADYVGLGPIFATQTKVVPAPCLGLARFAAIVAQSPLPVVGIGGIGLVQMAEVARAGAHAAAVASALFAEGELVAQARALNDAFQKGAGRVA